MAITSADDLRRKMIDDIQYMLDRPLRYWLVDEQKRVLRAQMSYWQDASAAVMEDLYNRFKKASRGTGEVVYPENPPAEPDDPEGGVP